MTGDAQNESQKPLNQAQVQQEAHKLETIADNFLGGHNEEAAFDAWQKEVRDICAHGTDSVKAVFQQMQGDCKGLNPLLPHIDVVQDGKTLQIEVTSSVLNGVFGLNYRDIGSVVDQYTVYSGADAGRNLIVGQRHLTAYEPVARQKP